MFGLRLSPIGLVPQNNCHNQMISDYSYFGVNDELFPLAPLDYKLEAATSIILTFTE